MGRELFVHVADLAAWAGESNRVLRFLRPVAESKPPLRLPHVEPGPSKALTDPVARRRVRRILVDHSVQVDHERRRGLKIGGVTFASTATTAERHKHGGISDEDDIGGMHGLFIFAGRLWKR